MGYTISKNVFYRHLSHTSYEHLIHSKMSHNKLHGLTDTANMSKVCIILVYVRTLFQLQVFASTEPQNR